jgi:hypothetical protein
LLVRGDLVRGAGLDTSRALAAATGANGTTGLVGAPALGANARGAADLAPTLAAADAFPLVAASQGNRLGAILLVGDEAWADLDTGSARRVLATYGPLPADDPRIDVVLPLAHPYERQATLTNLEGRVQLQKGGASPPPYARADWGVAAELAAALGANGVPHRLDEIWGALAAVRPGWAQALESLDGMPPDSAFARSNRDPAYAQTVVPPFGARTTGGS